MMGGGTCQGAASSQGNAARMTAVPLESPPGMTGSLWAACPPRQPPQAPHTCFGHRQVSGQGQVLSIHDGKKVHMQTALSLGLSELLSGLSGRESLLKRTQLWAGWYFPYRWAPGQELSLQGAEDPRTSKPLGRGSIGGQSPAWESPRGARHV